MKEVHICKRIRDAIESEMQEGMTEMGDENHWRKDDINNKSQSDDPSPHDVHAKTLLLNHVPGDDVKLNVGLINVTEHYKVHYKVPGTVYIT